MPPNNRDNAWQFANAQGDPYGNESYEQSREWAEAYLRANPGWQGNATWKVVNGRIEPVASWLDRNGWIFPAAVGGGLLAGPAIAGAVGGGGGAAAGGVLPSSTIPGLHTAVPGAISPSIGAGSGVGTGAGAAGAASGARSLLPNSAKDYAQLAGLVPMLAGLRGGGGDNPFGGASSDAVMDELRKAMEMQRGRVQQAQPVYDTLVRMAQNSAPNASYGGPAYEYRGPQFGGR